MSTIKYFAKKCPDKFLYMLIGFSGVLVLILKYLRKHNQNVVQQPPRQIENIQPNRFKRKTSVPETFKLKKITNQLFMSIINQSKAGEDFVGDVETCVLISALSLKQLKSVDHAWLQLTTCGSHEKNILSGSGEVIDETDKNNPYRLIQCIAADVDESTLYVTTDLYFNIQSSLDMYIVSNVEYIDVANWYPQPDEQEEFYPNIALSAQVSLISSSFDIADKDVDDILLKYFYISRYLCKNDVFTVDLTEYAPLLTYSSGYFHVSSITFKVTEIQSSKTADTEGISIGMYIVKGITSLHCRSSVMSFIPPKVYKYIKSVDGGEISIQPSGLQDYYVTLRNTLLVFIRNSNLQVRPMFLLSGPSGSGKMVTIRSVASSLGLHILELNCFDLYGQTSSFVESKLNMVFEKLKKTLPCVLVLLNYDLLGKDKEDAEDVRIVDSFQTHFQELLLDQNSEFPVFIVGVTTSRPDSLLPSMRRCCVQTVEFKPLTEKEVLEDLKWFKSEREVMCNLEALEYVASSISGFVHEDLKLLVDHAESKMREESLVEMTKDHFLHGLGVMEACYSDTIGAPRIPTVLWSDIGGLEELKTEIKQTIEFPLNYPELAESGLKRSGILFYGPPGTGKTLVAKAVATEFKLNFLSVKGAELMNMYVGQSEQNVRDVFARARDAAPCIIFFDELDSLAPRRGRSGDSGGVSDRVVSQLLSEMDGLQQNVNLFIIGATNRPDLVDSALLRPGRFDKSMYVGPCDNIDSKKSVFRALTKKFHLADDVDVDSILRKIPKYVTGADIYSVCSNAWLAAARRNIVALENGGQSSLPINIHSFDFEEALKVLVPSVKREDLLYYEELRRLQR